MLTHYEVLGVEPTADTETIKRAWRVRLLVVHPDRHETGSEEARAEATNEMLLVNNAWETLRDPLRRRLYDRQLAQFVDAATRARAGEAPGPHRSSAPAPGPDDAELTVRVTCNGCKASRQIAGTAVRFACPSCNTAWRFVVCERCHEHANVNERWGTWTCPRCSEVHTSYWGGLTKPIVCVRCKAATEVALGTPIFRCEGCSREYQRCACNHYTSFPSFLGRRWRCPACRKMNERFVDPATKRNRSIQQLLDDRRIDAPGAAKAFAAHIRPDLDGVARVGPTGEDGVVAVAGDAAAVWWRDGRAVQTVDLRSFEWLVRDGRRITLRSSSGTELCVLASSDNYAESWTSYMTSLGVAPAAPPAKA